MEERIGDGKESIKTLIINTAVWDWELRAKRGYRDERAGYSNSTAS